MDWLLFIFKRETWNQLCRKQSCRLDIAKKEYTLLSVLNGNQKIIKL